jgi:hypothetical protein
LDELKKILDGVTVDVSEESLITTIAGCVVSSEIMIIKILK